MQGEAPADLVELGFVARLQAAAVKEDEHREVLRLRRQVEVELAQAVFIPLAACVLDIFPRGDFAAGLYYPR